MDPANGSGDELMEERVGALDDEEVLSPGSAWVEVVGKD
jgi:hypothetical protein